MINQNTYDQINEWATDKYATAAPSLSAAAAPQPTSLGSYVPPASGMLGAGTSSAPTVATASAPATPDWSMAAATPTTTSPAPTPAPAAAPESNANVGNWYRSTLGRDGDASGMSYWQGRINGGEDAQTLYKEFRNSALANNETVKGTDWASANAAGSIGMPGNSTPAPTATSPAIASGPTLMDTSALAHRTINPATETVAGQLKSVLATDSPVMQQARADAMRTANERGMLNSAMAASGGEDAAIRSALSIATPDAGYYNHASDYNAAADNQATMYNATAQNDFAKQQLSINAETAARNAQLGQQMSLAQMQDATSRYQADTSSATSKYNTDATFRNQAENNKKTLVNNIIGNMDMSPDRKAAMLEQLGEGTSTVRAPDGSIKPGTGLAGAVYVIDSVAGDLNFGSMTDQQRAQQAASQAVGNG